MLPSNKKAFTMIEMVFVIVIIGILAAVAMPKMVGMKDAANASTCVHEVGQLMQEIVVCYTGSKTFDEWKTNKLEDNVTNIRLNVDTSGNGIHNSNETVYDHIISYHCDGKKIAELETSTNANGNYQLRITIEAAPSSPASLKASNILQKQYTGIEKVFVL